MKPLIRRRGERRSSAGKRKSARRPGTLRGCMRNVIVVKPPDRRFREAVFILRDDYFLSEGIGEAELLRQAREAASEYVQESLPPVGIRLPWALLGFALLVVLVALKLLEVI